MSAHAIGRRARALIRAASFALALAPGCSETRAPKVGEPLRPFAAKTSTGAAVHVPGDALGRAVVLHFWSTECPYCRPEMQGLEALAKELGPARVRVYFANVGDTPEAATKLATELGLTQPVLLDEAAARAKDYGVVALPTTVLVDRAGVVATKILGETDLPTIRRELEALTR